jgi:hypothetical protein
MKSILKTFFFASLVVLWSCGQKSHDHDHEGHDHDHDEAGQPVESEGNQALYDKVMDVHDEVMPKMDDMYKLKKELEEKIASTPGMVEEKKKEIETTIVKLDSASEGMMVWMREFNPIPDSLGEEKAREYLENEMEKVKKVREDILEAIEKAKKQE